MDLAERLRGFCSPLPEVTERASHGAPAWWVAGKMFAQLWASGHHDHTVPQLWCAAPPYAQAELIAADDRRFFRPPYVGHRGWIGVRLNNDPDWAEIAGLCEDAYRTVAPKRLTRDLTTMPDLPFTLNPAGSPPCQVLRDGDTLTLTAAAKTDMFIDPGAAAGEVLPDAGRLVGTPPEGDFRFSARVSPAFGAVFDAGVLLVYAGERHWAKLCYELSPRHVPTAVSVVTRGSSDDCNSFETGGEPLWLRVARIGHAWAFHASLDGDRWRMLRYFALGSSAGPVPVGLMPQSPTGAGCAVTFDQISFTAGAPADLRDGS
jgi:regulation of enolase protein 1 (concanavalin A-like superfamily)